MSSPARKKNTPTTLTPRSWGLATAARATITTSNTGPAKKGHTIVALELYFIGGRAKVEIAVGVGK